MQSISVLFSIALAWLLVGARCEQEPQELGGDTPSPRALYIVESSMKDCPIALPGTRAQMLASNDSVALRFTAHQSDLAELQRRLYVLAERYDAQEARYEVLWRNSGRLIATKHRHGEYERRKRNAGPHGQLSMPLVTALVVSRTTGASVVLTPHRRAELPRLRAQVGEHYAHMQAGECWMRQPRSIGALQLSWWDRMLGRR